MTTPTSYILHTMPAMDGWCSIEKATALANTVLKHKPTVCVEIGVYAGRSLFAIATALQQLGQGRVLGIDPWTVEASVAGWENDPANRDWWSGKTSKLDHNAIYQQCCEYRKKLQLEACTEIFVGTSDEAAKLLRIVSYALERHAQRPTYIDLLHIDGNHSEQQALRDVQNYVPLVEPGGFVFFDDMSWGTTKPAQQLLDKLCTYQETVTDCGIYCRR
jgi:predicted O-methyltransferase YrrM